MSKQKPSHEFEGIVHRAPREDCVEAQISAALEIQEQWPPSFLNGTTKTLPRAGRPAKLRNQGRRALVRDVNLMVTLFSGREWETSQNRSKDER